MGAGRPEPAGTTRTIHDAITSASIPRRAPFTPQAPSSRQQSQLRTGTTNPSVTESDPVELQRLYVDRRAIGHGVGGTLMQASLDAVRSAGHGTIWLGVWERNARAISFYERWQFKTVGDHEFQLGSDHQTDMIMARPVPGAA